MKKSKAYQPDLIESLRNTGEAEEHLNAALDENDPELFLLALRNVTETQGSTTRRENQAQPRKSLQDALRTRQS